MLNPTLRKHARATFTLALTLIAGQACRAADAPAIVRTPVERMARERLKATHEDVVRIQASRRTLPPITGLTDFRAILHAHAEDSAHTGGTRPEMLADAKVAGVHAILLTDHLRPPKDFITDTWRGLRDGILFIPGSEDRGFLVYPARSIMARMKDETPAFIQTVKADGGLIFLSHIEERPQHPMEGLDGLEIVNRHYDAKRDSAGLLALALRLTNPTSLRDLEDCLRLYPDELFASQIERPSVYLDKWDAETTSRRLTGVAANDCHHNQVLIVKMIDRETVRVGTNVDRDDQMRVVTARLRPGLRAMTEGRKPGDILARLDVDPYRRSFKNVSTHLLAPALTEAAVRDALHAGHAYVSHDWLADPTGFRFELTGGERVSMGDEVKFTPGRTIVAEFPVPCKAVLLRGGKAVAERSGDRLAFEVAMPGVYRIEARLVVDGEERPWIYSNPIYVR